MNFSQTLMKIIPLSQKSMRPQGNSYSYKLRLIHKAVITNMLHYP